MEFPSHLPIVEIALRLGAAALLGAMLGLERELKGKAAGLRTHMLVALGAGVTMIAALELDGEGAGPGDTVDAGRAIQGVMSGIGFLGAGVIIRGGGDKVQGLTTAANIWLTGAIGLACGAGHYGVAGMTTLFSLLILVGLGSVERLIQRRRGRPEDQY